jgi:DNA-binding CsgD family transcriptional regulator
VSGTEEQLFQHIHELMMLVRPMGKEIHLDFNVEVADPMSAIFMINNQKSKNAVIDNSYNTYHLSEREKEILSLIIEGYTNKNISKKLFISFETVRSHRKKILAKTKCKNTALLLKHYYNTIPEMEIFSG